MIRHKHTITYTTGAYDIKTWLGEDVIENHLKLTYSDETAYLDALVAAAWDRVEVHLGIRYAAHTVNWEAQSFATKIQLPVEADRVAAVTVDYWNGDSYEAATDVRTSNIGYPVCLEVDSDDAVLGNRDADAGTILMKVTATVAESTPPPSIQQAFLLYLGYLYEKREAVVTGTIATELPRAYEYLLNGYRVNSIIRF